MSQSVNKSKEIDARISEMLNVMFHEIGMEDPLVRSILYAVSVDDVSDFNHVRDDLTEHQAAMLAQAYNGIATVIEMRAIRVQLTRIADSLHTESTFYPTSISVAKILADISDNLNRAAIY